MKVLMLVGFLCPLANAVIAQSESAEQHYAGTITEADLRRHLDVLASDSLEGRETGEYGQRLAAQYIKDQFQAFGIPPLTDAKTRGLMVDGYQQQFPLKRTRLGGLSLELVGKQRTFLKDYYYYSEQLRKDLITSEVMVLTPLSLGGVHLGGAAKVVMLLEGNEVGGLQRQHLDQAMKVLRDAGTEVVFLVDDSAKSTMVRNAGLLSYGRMRIAKANSQENDGGPRNQSLQLIFITPELCQTILDQGNLTRRKVQKSAGRKRISVNVPLRFTYSPKVDQLHSENVLGFVEGTDKKNEVVVVTAHYDHIGVIGGEVYNGADDDGSGTVALLEMAQAFALAKANGHGPRRSLLFMALSGEEKGLLGSEWYADHPVFPMDSTVVDLNIDMIGRTDSVHGDSSHYVYVIGSRRISSELGAIIEAVNARRTGLELDYTFDAESDPNRFYYRSDHYNFAKHGVPIAFFFNGVHADYHGPYDEVDKIRFDLLRVRTLLVFHTAWELANRDARILEDGEGADHD